ncbi:unnamed protein product, partial [Ectocarpus sp. 13 AM-2016]
TTFLWKSKLLLPWKLPGRVHGSWLNGLRRRSFVKPPYLRFYEGKFPTLPTRTHGEVPWTSSSINSDGSGIDSHRNKVLRPWKLHTFVIQRRRPRGGTSSFGRNQNRRVL